MRFMSTGKVDGLLNFHTIIVFWKSVEMVLDRPVVIFILLSIFQFEESLFYILYWFETPLGEPKQQLAVLKNIRADLFKMWDAVFSFHNLGAVFFPETNTTPHFSINTIIPFLSIEAVLIQPEPWRVLWDSAHTFPLCSLGEWINGWRPGTNLWRSSLSLSSSWPEKQNATQTHTRIHMHRHTHTHAIKKGSHTCIDLW